ncbi:MAG: hypothetical protein AAF705_20235 [Bacteroidota bacterium]
MLFDGVNETIDSLNELSPTVKLEWDIPTSALLAGFLLLAIAGGITISGFILGINK